MKKLYNLSLLLALSLSLTAQWQTTNPYPGGSAYSVASFTIGGKAYLGGGNPSLNSFYEFDKSTGNWTSLGSIPGGVNRASPIRFSINGKGYIGCGSDMGQPSTQTFYEYDPVADSWTQKADFGGGDRHSGFYASANGKGYVFCGSDASSSTDEVWEYDPSTDSWTQKASYPAGAIYWPTGFVINDKIYVCTGSASGTGTLEVHMYDSTNDTWTQKANFIGTGRSAAVGFSVAGKGYVVGGVDGSFANLNTAYSYDPVADTWQAETSLDHPSTSTAWSTAFVLGGDAYLGTGATVTTGISPSSTFYSANIGGSINIEEDHTSDTQVFPNPTNGIITLLRDDMEEAQIEIKDLNGRLVHSQTAKKSETIIDLKHLTKGTYLLSMVNDKGIPYIHRIMLY